MKTGKIILIGGIVLLMLALIAFIVGGAFVYHVAQSPKGMSIKVESPEKIKKNETYELRVVVVNERPDKPLKVGSIDIGADYLYGVTVKSCEPPFRSSAQIPMNGGRTFDFDTTIPPGATNIFSFKLRAKNAGSYSGDVDVCEGMQFMTMVTEIEILDSDEKAEPADPP